MEELLLVTDGEGRLAGASGVFARDPGCAETQCAIGFERLWGEGTSMAQDAAWICVDWGQAYSRAVLVGSSGRVLAQRGDLPGQSTLPDGGFEAAARKVLTDWIDSYRKVPVVMCGAVGGASGWVDASYARCPVSVEGLGQQVAYIEWGRKRQLAVVPGLVAPGFGGTVDTVRGAETVVAGVLKRVPKMAGWVCILGESTTWVRVSDGTIQGFATFETDGLIGYLRYAGPSSSQIEGDVFDVDAFRQGVQAARNAGSILHHARGARLRCDTGELDATSAASWQAGMVIGHEIREMSPLLPEGAPVVMVGDARRGPSYLEALRAYNQRPLVLDRAQTVIDGMVAIGETVRW